MIDGALQILLEGIALLLLEQIQQYGLIVAWICIQRILEPCRTANLLVYDQVVVLVYILWTHLEFDVHLVFNLYF